MGNDVLQMFASAFVAVLALTGTGARVSAQTHHVLAGDDVGSETIQTEDSFVELKPPEELDSCDLTNPIKMYTDTTTPESCNNGLKLPVSVRSHEYWPPTPEYGPPEHAQPPPEYAQPPPEHAQPPPEYGPPEYAQPPPEHAQPPPEHAQPPPEHAQPPPEHAQPPPEHAQPPPEYGPPEHAQPPPKYGPPEHSQPPPKYGPPEHSQPPPVFRPPPPPRTPSAANYLNGLSFVLFAGLLVCSIGMKKV